MTEPVEKRHACEIVARRLKDYGEKVESGTMNSTAHKITALLESLQLILEKGEPPDQVSATMAAEHLAELPGQLKATIVWKDLEKPAREVIEKLRKIASEGPPVWPC